MIPGCYATDLITIQHDHLEVLPRHQIKRAEIELRHEHDHPRRGQDREDIVVLETFGGRHLNLSPGGWMELTADTLICDGPSNPEDENRLYCVTTILKDAADVLDAEGDEAPWTTRRVIEALSQAAENSEHARGRRFLTELPPGTRRTLAIRILAHMIKTAKRDLSATNDIDAIESWTANRDSGTAATELRRLSLQYRNLPAPA